MIYEFQVINEKNSSQKYLFETLPEECPICHIRIVPIYKYGYAFTYDRSVTSYDVQAIFQCPAKECRNLFIGYYSTVQSSCLLKSVAPSMPMTTDFGKTIEAISIDFIEIYHQSSIAEQIGLNQIAGPGYRKALEFLIKDYTIKNTNSESEIKTIKKNFLAEVIKTNIADERIKRVAERATWLGNDETHYVKKFEDKDVKDLKKLINMTIHWIELVEESKSAETDMPSNK